MPDEVKHLEQLIARFRADSDRFCRGNSSYSETEARVEFIDPLFVMLGWDMANSAGLPNGMKDVIREESQPTETTAKRPDYTFRVSALRKFFVEAKKPAVDIRSNRDAAYQVRSYGWTAGLSVSVLTNFRSIRVYDTRTAPVDGDDTDVALLMEIDYEELPTRFLELLECFGREAVGKGSVEKRFGSVETGTIPVNGIFLDRINGWRTKIATDLKSRYAALDIESINDIAQRLISRVIFIRMCEDRGIEGEERLREVAAQKSKVVLRRLFKELDDRYNTGLFDVTSDPLNSTYEIDSVVLLSIVEELYFPRAPYTFSVLDADFLGQVYERFLVKQLHVAAGGGIELVDKPAYEGREIITTPQPLVDEIVRRAVRSRLQSGEAEIPTYQELLGVRILDIAVGSGRFLIRALDELVDAAVARLLQEGGSPLIYKKAEGDYRLAFAAKSALLSQCLFGIDIDYNAVEIARLSLVIKLLEDESRATLPSGERILPNLDKNIAWGNSVVADDFTDPDKAVRDAVRPFSWSSVGIPEAVDVVVGNPPYVKTEEMKVTNPKEFAYYKSHYETPYKQFDKYFVFLERSIQALRENGCVGLVLPNKWMTIESGSRLRAVLASNRLVSELVDFGNELLFEGKSTYVCLLVLSKIAHDKLWYRHVDAADRWLLDPSSKGIELELELVTKFGGGAWILPADETEAKVLKALFADSVLLGDIADVNNGIQTSAEDVFPIEVWKEENGLVVFERKKKVWAVEEKITQPYVMDSAKHVSSYRLIQGDALVVFPYEYSADGDAVLIPPKRLAKEFPHAWKYLKAHEARLNKRDVSPPPAAGEFYRYGRHQALASSFQAPKIVYSVNQLGDKYGLDLSGVGFASGGTAGEVAICNPRGGYSLEFILAVLNQRAVEFFLRKRGSPFRGGYYSRGSAVISDLPIPKVDFSNAVQVKAHKAITALVKRAVKLQTALPGLAGRRRETALKDREALDADIRKLFEVFWDFGGSDTNLNMPGA